MAREREKEWVDGKIILAVGPLKLVSRSKGFPTTTPIEIKPKPNDPAFIPERLRPEFNTVASRVWAELSILDEDTRVGGNRVDSDPNEISSKGAEESLAELLATEGINPWNLSLAIVKNFAPEMSRKEKRSLVEDVMRQINKICGL